MHAMNRRLSMFRSAVPLALLLVLLTAFHAAAERIQLDIASSGVRKLAVAVPSFANGSGNPNSAAGKDIARLVISGLEFHGFIQIVEGSTNGADYVVQGRYSSMGGQMMVEASLLDTAAGKTLPTRQFRGSAAQQDDLVLRLVDALVEDFTGEPGISRTSIAFVSDSTGSKEVYIADVLGRNVRQITRHNHLCVSPRFSIDGSKLAYSSYHRGNQNLYITDLNQNRTTKAISRREGMNLAPAFSPDGRTMIVTLSRDGSPDLYRMDMQGQILDRLTQGSGINVSPSFSPDGSQVAFVSDRSGKPQVYVMDIGSKRTRLLTLQGKENVEPSWSPKGDKIAYTSLTSGRYHIFTIPVGGGSPTRITSSYGDYESPTWSPDGKQIAFARKRNGQMELCIIHANGKGERTLFRLKGNQSYPRWSPRRN
ncbi:MAG: TolB protein [Candidatus Electronema aureum]|uniref:TolB protein n=1 Tax=Candidatus Electronema aureum TaxID=2005002 RepID=A0A521G3L0_9BACT|nr:MAG: TolB protein [Candidatus Electronema aureum]